MDAGPAMAGIDEEKRDVAGRVPAFELPACTVYRSRSGLTFTDHLDPEPGLVDAEPRALTEQHRRYLREQLGADAGRVERQLALIERELGSLGGCALLDLGPGAGGLMLRAQQRGARATGLEPDMRNLRYARERGLTVHHATAEQHARADAHTGRYDAITLWDVLEHVNQPDATLAACARLLRPGGVLLLDTPCRDGAFHRLGELAYRATGGRYTRLLELLYAAHDYGHKQILSSSEVQAALERAGLCVTSLKTFHELALPHESYLTRLTRSESAARAIAPFTRAVLGVAGPHNKVLAIARRSQP